MTDQGWTGGSCHLLSSVIFIVCFCRATYQENLLSNIPIELHSLIPEATLGYFRFEAADNGKKVK